MDDPRFTANGKQVKDRGQHYADARSEIDAGLIAAAMNEFVIKYNAKAFGA